MNASSTPTADMDPWERLAAARARRAIRSPIAQAAVQRATDATDATDKTRQEHHESATSSDVGADTRGNGARTISAKLTHAQHEHMLQLAEQGWTAPQIATELKLKTPRVQAWARRHQITLADARAAGGPGRTPSWDVELAIQLARSGMTVSQIAQQVDAKSETVRRVLKRRGVPLVDARLRFPH